MCWDLRNLDEDVEMRLVTTNMNHVHFFSSSVDIFPESTMRDIWLEDP